MPDDTERLNDATERIGSVETQRLGDDNADITFQPALGLKAGYRIAGRFVVEKSIGYGGESDVFLCRDSQQNGKLVVVKLYRLKFQPNADILQKLIGLNHPDILCLLQVGEFNNRVFEVSEYAVGGTLEGLKLDEKTLKETVLKEVINAFRYCHPRGIIHRDIKPQNLFYRDIDRSDIVVADFGLAALLPSELSLRLSERAGKTELYSAPELFASQGQVVGMGVDYYALGMTLLVLLRGKEPYEAGTPIEQIRIDKIEGNVPIPEYCSKGFESLLKGLLHPNRNKRWGLDQVEKWFDGKTVVVQEIDRVDTSSHFEFEFERGVFAHSLEELARMLLEHPDRGKVLIAEGMVAGALERRGRESTALELRNMVKGSTPIDVVLVHTIYALDKSLPYRFQTGVDVRTPQQLAKAMDKDDLTTKEGERQLYNGMILTWLQLTEQKAIVKKWEELKSSYQTKKRQGLEVFLHALDPNLPYPAMKVEPRSINFGRVEVDTSRTAVIRISNTGRGLLSGQITVEGKGVRVKPENFEGNSNEINVHFTAKELPAGRQANIKINIESTIGSASTITVPVKAQIGYPIFTNLSLFFDRLITNGAIAFILVAGTLWLLMPLFEPAFADKAKAAERFVLALRWDPYSGGGTDYLKQFLVGLLLLIPFIIWHLLLIVLYLVAYVLLASYQFYILHLVLGLVAARELKDRIRDGRLQVNGCRGIFAFLFVALVVVSLFVIMAPSRSGTAMLESARVTTVLSSPNADGTTTALPSPAARGTAIENLSPPRTGVISVDGTGLREVASETSSFRRMLGQNAQVKVLQRTENGFYRVKLADGSEGFVRWDQVSFGKPSVPLGSAGVPSIASEIAPEAATLNRESSEPSPRPRPTASGLSGKWEVFLAKSPGSETQDRIEMTLSNQSNTSLSGSRFYIRGSGGTSDRIEIGGSWDPSQRRVELREPMDSSKPWEAATRGVFIGTLSEDGDRLEGTWTRYSGGQTDKRNFKRVR